MERILIYSVQIAAALFWGFSGVLGAGSLNAQDQTAPSSEQSGSNATEMASPAPSTPTAPEASAPTPGESSEQPESADSPSPLEQSVLRQVFLDRAGFGPGVIDGREGEFTRKAIVEYEKAHQMVGVNAGTLPVSQASPALIEYTVSTEDENRIGAAPEKPEEQGSLKWLPYRSVLELVSEKFHTSQEFLKQLNPGLGDGLKAGDRVRVPNVEPFEIGAVEAKRTEEEAPEAKEKEGGRWLDIDVAQKELEVREGDRIVAAFPITPGSSHLPAPRGHWHVQTITFMPKFRYDPEMLYHGERGEHGIVTPPGPNNKVGVVWMNLNKKGVGIHGTDEPETIGRTTSHGCIRLSNWDVVRVAAMIKPGAKVIIH